MLITLGDLYADSCIVCGERAEFGMSDLKGPEGCIDALRTGKTFCDKHIPRIAYEQLRDKINAMLEEKKV